MSNPATQRSPIDDDRGTPPRGIARFLYTHNPFYVISAWFMFTGLRISFDPQAGMFDTTTLMLCLAAYTLLLAGTAWLLIRLGQVWQDVRGLLLLIVMMFMAASVIIDDVMAVNLTRGIGCYLGGLVFSISLSEGLLRKLGIRLPALYRFPYYLLLGLFFLYPPALGVYLVAPGSSWLPWGLLAFPTVAGILALSLLPAIRRGAAYVEQNGTPWRWPLFPWTLFLFLGGGVCLRAYYLCVSQHQVGGASTIFGFYFLTPLLLAVSLLILEAGLATGSRRAQKIALLLPILGVLGVAVPYDGGVVYRRFLAEFLFELGASPLFFTLGGAIFFHALALVRRAPLADVALAASLAGLSLVGPQTIDTFQGPVVTGLGLAMSGAALLLTGLARWDSRRTLAATVCLILALTIALQDTWFTAYDGFLPLNLFVASLVVIGMVFDDLLGRWLHRLAPLAMLAAGVTVAFMATQRPDEAPLAVGMGYPLLLAIVSGLYGHRQRDRLYQITSMANVAAALTAGGARGYLALQPHVPGLDKIAVSLVFFTCAILISLYKAGQVPRLLRWLGQRFSLPDTKPDISV